jgi:hypothetical protein
VEKADHMGLDSENQIWGRLARIEWAFIIFFTKISLRGLGADEERGGELATTSILQL